MKREKSVGSENVPGTLFTAAEFLRDHVSHIPELIQAMRETILEHSRQVPSAERVQPKNMLESRFTPAEEAFKKGMVSCGTLASISVEMLRHLGLKAKLVHGETNESVDHAWISVLDPEKGVWEDYDLTREDATVTPQHIKKMETDSWEEIRERIEEDDRTREERKRTRGIE